MEYIYRVYGWRLEGGIERLEHENERIYTKLDDNDKEIERLNKERNKTYENGLNYFLELQEKKEEIERLHNIIKEVREYVNTDKNCISKHIKDYINNLLDKEILNDELMEI